MKEKCRICGTSFVISDEDVKKYKALNLKLPRLCPECRRLKHQFAPSRECIDCGKIFILTELDVLHYDRKGLSIPKRCPQCREFKRLNGGL